MDPHPRQHDPGEPVPDPPTGTERLRQPAPDPSPELLDQRLPPPVVLPPSRPLVARQQPRWWSDRDLRRDRLADLGLVLLAVVVAVVVAVVLSRPPA